MNTILMGYPVIYSVYCGTYEDKIVPRTWRERLLSRPWRPWEKTKTVNEFVPNVLMVGSPPIIVAHPSLKDAVEAEVAKLGRAYEK